MAAITPLTDQDWELILPYLQENERLFGIKVDELLTVDGKRRIPAEFIAKLLGCGCFALGKKVWDDEGSAEPETLVIKRKYEYDSKN